jgi:hypothetical protein
MKNKSYYKIITLLIPLLCLTTLFFKNAILSVTEHFPPCILFSTLHLYCPACGNTRSVIALLNFDLLSALHYNIVPPILLFLCIAAYIELASYSYGRHIRILPRKLKVYLIGIGLIFVYLILRNFIPQLAP